MKNAPKLTIDQKRQIAYEWFTDPVKPRIKSLDQGRRFVRLCVQDLKLRELRSLRTSENEMRVNEIAKARIMTYRPAANRQVHADGVAGAIKSKTALNDIVIRALLINWLDSDKPLGRFLQQERAFKHRGAIRPIVKAAELRQMRRQMRRGVDIDVEAVRVAAISKIDEVLAARKMRSVESCGGNKNNETTEEDTLDIERLTLGKGADSAGTFKPELKSLLVEWFDHPDKASIVDFLAEKGLPNRLRRDMRQAVRTGQLQKMRKNRNEDGMHAQAMQTIESLFANADNVHQDFKPPANTSGATVDQDEIKKLVTAWFDDGDLAPLRKFLRAQGGEARHLIPTVLPLVKSNSLQKLRKKRADPQVYADAMARIDNLFFSAEGEAEAAAANKIKKGVATVRLQKGKAPAIAQAEQDLLKQYLDEWFYDDHLISIPAFLASKGVANPEELRPKMARLVTRLGLRKLRKERHAIHVIAAKRIDRASTAKGMSKMKKRGGIKGGCNKAKVAAVTPVVHSAAEAAPAPLSTDLMDDEYVAKAVADDDATDFVVIH